MSNLTDDGAKKLAAAILGLAHDDYTSAKVKTIEDTTKIKAEAASARHFLHTEWCRDLCGLLDVDYQKFVEITIQKSHLAQPVYKYLEAEIRDYHRSINEIEQIKRDVAECNHVETNKGGHSIAVGNPTERKGLRLATDEKLDRLERMVAVIGAVYNDIPEDRKEMVRLKYWTRLYTDEGIAEKLQIDRATFYRWKREFVLRVAIKLGYL